VASWPVKVGHFERSRRNFDSPPNGKRPAAAVPDRNGPNRRNCRPEINGTNKATPKPRVDGGAKWRLPAASGSAPVELSRVRGQQRASASRSQSSSEGIKAANAL